MSKTIRTQQGNNEGYSLPITCL